MKQRLKTHAVIFKVDKHYRNQQQKLRKCKTHRIFHAEQPLRKYPPHHMPHRYVEQWNGKQCGQKQPLFHLSIFFLRCVCFWLCCPVRRSVYTLLLILNRFRKCPISGFFNCLHNSHRIQNRLIIRSNHTVFQQVYGYLLYSRQLRYTFLNSCRAGGTGHTRNVKLLLLQNYPFFLSKFVTVYYPSPVGEWSCYRFSL